jgi:hypothetical protein
MKAATAVITDWRCLLIATPIGLTTEGPIITGVQSREPFHPSILTERHHRLIRVRLPQRGHHYLEALKWYRKAADQGDAADFKSTGHSTLTAKKNKDFCRFFCSPRPMMVL